MAYTNAVNRNYEEQQSILIKDEEFKNKVRALIKSREEYKARNEDLQLRLAEAERMMEELRQGGGLDEELARENNELRARISWLESPSHADEIQTVKGQNSELKSALQSFKTKNEELSQENSEMRRMVAEQNEQIIALKEAIAQTSATIADLERRIEEEKRRAEGSMPYWSGQTAEQAPSRNAVSVEEIKQAAIESAVAAAKEIAATAARQGQPDMSVQQVASPVMQPMPQMMPSLPQMPMVQPPMFQQSVYPQQIQMPYYGGLPQMNPYAAFQQPFQQPMIPPQMNPYAAFQQPYFLQQLPDPSRQNRDELRQLKNSIQDLADNSSRLGERMRTVLSRIEDNVY